MREIELFSDQLIGDRLMETPAIRALKQSNPDLILNYMSGTSKGTGCLLEHNPYINSLTIADAIPGDPPEVRICMDPAQAYAWGEANGRTLAEGYGSLFGVDVTDIRYDYTITEDEQIDARDYAADWNLPRVFIARHSASCSSNDERCGRIANKCVPNRIWVDVAKWLLKEGFMPVALGGPGEESDSRYREWPGQKLYGKPLREVAAMLPHAAAVLSVDTGIRHLAAAVGANLYCVSGVIPLSLIRCEPVKAGQKIFEEQVPLAHVTAPRIIKGVQKVLR